MKLTEQISFAELSPEYQAFVEKFKPKKTTDDCYTPEEIYDAVAEYVMERYGYKREQLVRPFWPGVDYREFDYPEGCCVCDNPPFSILSQIIVDYNRAGIRYFLFEPYLTALGRRGCAHIITASAIIYENGAEVPSSFCTNLEPGVIARAEPKLAATIKAVSARLRAATVKAVPKYVYPDAVVTSADLGYLAIHDTALTIREEDAFFIRRLDAQQSAGKGQAIFGSGYLLSTRAAAEKAAAEKAAAEKAAAEKAAAEKWRLSARELAIIATLDARCAPAGKEQMKA